MSTRRITRIVTAGALGLAGLGAFALVPVASASAATPSININAKCSGTSVSNLQVQREDTGAVSVDFGVDMARHTAGVPWKVAEGRNGTGFVSATVKTVKDGSFSVSRVLSPLAGTNTIVASAVNAKTGETCSITGSL
ncbi:MAG TPA: hypothetical protein VII96_10265 [Acidimicrobiales bacterium]